MPRLPGPLLPLVRAVVVFCALGSALAAAVKFDIPAQPALDAFRAFTRQSGSEVLYEAPLKSVAAHAVKGEMEPLEALRAMLAGSGY